MKILTVTSSYDQPKKCPICNKWTFEVDLCPSHPDLNPLFQDERKCPTIHCERPLSPFLILVQKKCFL